MAWDTGAVTTGCVTVPLILALGIGILTFVRAKGAVTATATGKAAGKAAAADLSGDTAMDLLGCAPPPASLDGFGIVTLASLFPVAFVLILGLLMNGSGTNRKFPANFAKANQPWLPLGLAAGVGVGTAVYCYLRKSRRRRASASSRQRRWPP